MADLEELSDRFVVTKLLGVGGMGAVWQAHQIDMDREVAIKLLTDSSFVDPDSRARFKAEIKIVSSLSHANIVAIYSTGVLSNGRPYFVMEMLEGQTFAELIRAGPLPYSRVLELMIPVCQALSHAHQRGITHRDIKPSNLMLVNDGGNDSRVVVTDFGIASFAGRSKITKTGDIVGSALYLSPERYHGQDSGPAADIYSVGCTMFELLTGAPPFLGSSPLETALKHQSEAPPPLSSANPEIRAPHSLQTVIDRCLEKRPEDRYVDANTLAEDLARVLAGEPTANSLERATSPKSSNRAVASVAKIAMLAVAALAIYCVGQFMLNQPAPVTTASDLPLHQLEQQIVIGKLQISRGQYAEGFATLGKAELDARKFKSVDHQNVIGYEMGQACIEMMEDEKNRGSIVHYLRSTLQVLDTAKVGTEEMIRLKQTSFEKGNQSLFDTNASLAVVRYYLEDYKGALKNCEECETIYRKIPTVFNSASSRAPTLGCINFFIKLSLEENDLPRVCRWIDILLALGAKAGWTRSIAINTFERRIISKVKPDKIELPAIAGARRYFARKAALLE